jgi:hypothetical protein
MADYAQQTDSHIFLAGLGGGRYMCPYLFNGALPTLGSSKFTGFRYLGSEGQVFQNS